MAIYGRRVDHPAIDGGWGSLANNEQRGYTPAGGMPSHGWAWRWGGRVGRADATTVEAYGAVWVADSSGNPGAKVGDTGTRFVVTTLMIDNASGTNVLKNFTTPWKAHAGTRYTIGAHSDIGLLSHGQNADGTRHYRKFGSSTPTDPFGHTESSPEGQISFFFEYEPNVAPDTPGSLAPSGLITDTTPTMTGTFSDDNTTITGFGANPSEEMKRYQIEVRRASDGVAFWSPGAFSANLAERTAAAFSRTYTGTPLVAGTEYEWRCRVSDQFDAWSPWTAWTSFTVNAGGAVDTSLGTPTGKQETVTPGPFTGTWDHASGLSTDRVQVRIKQGSTVVKTGAEVTKTVADNGTISISWAESGLTTLSWNVATYAYQIRARDTGGIWSEWSAGRAFSTNASPGVPTNLSPRNGAASTNRPLLTCTATDTDDTTATGLTVTARTKSSPVVANPTFETNATGWAVSSATAGITHSGVTRDAALSYDAVGGSGKVQITANSAGIGAIVNVVWDTFVPVWEGFDYAFSLAVRTDNANITPRLLRFYFDDAFAQINGVAESDWTPTINTWGNRSYESTAPANARWIKYGVQLYCDTAGALGSVWFDLLTPNGVSVRRVRTMTLSGSTWQFQTDAEDLPDFDFYYWDAYAFDGTLYSGAQTDEADASVSVLSHFIYAEGPTVTITAPTEDQVLTTSAVTVTWTADDQVKYRVRVREDQDGSNWVYDTGTVVSATQSIVIPSGTLHEDVIYNVYVDVTNSLTLVGTSTERDFSIDYTPPNPVTGVVATTELAGFDREGGASAIRVSWDQTAEAQPPWNEYLVYRREEGQDFTDSILLTRITSPTQTTFVDYLPASGVTYRYAVLQNVTQGADETLSEPGSSEATASVAFQGVILCDARDGGTYRTVLRYASGDGALRRIPRVRNKQTHKPWGTTKPVIVQTNTNYRQIDETFAVVTDSVDAATTVLDALEALVDRDAELCVRDERGRKVFVDITEYEPTDEPIFHYTVRLLLTEIDFTEGDDG